MNVYYTPPEHEFYIIRAREMRAEMWRNIFARVASTPAYLAGQGFDKVSHAIDDKRVTP